MRRKPRKKAKLSLKGNKTSRPSTRVDDPPLNLRVNQKRIEAFLAKDPKPPASRK
jgi:hypothetical protein